MWIIECIIYGKYYALTYAPRAPNSFRYIVFLSILDESGNNKKHIMIIISQAYWMTVYMYIYM